MTIERIVVEPPGDEARRDRIERRVLDALAIEPPRPVLAPRRRARLVMAGSLPLALVAAAVIVWLAVRRTGPADRVSEITTPPGGATRVQLDDSVLEVAGDSSLRVVQRAGGATTVELARGKVTCDVEPRPSRAPFRVLAGEVTVEVVGTRFTVERAAEVHVTVERGKVRVNGEALVGTGEAWPPAPPPPAPAAPSPPILSPEAPRERRPAAPPTREELLSRAGSLEQKDRPKMIRILGDLAKGNDTPAQEATFMLVQMGERGLDEYLRRFPSGEHVEDVHWIRVERHLSAGRKAEARKAALIYLEAHPKGTYADPARRVLAAP